MRKLLVVVAFLLGMGCGEFPEENEILQYNETNNKENFKEPLGMYVSVKSPDYNTLKICFKELVIINYNCWFIVCHAPCIPSDPGCHDSYCEWESEENNPRKE